jgi:hypothetical protein
MPKPSATPPAVLVIEDDQDVAMTINDVVEERGYRAICVPTESGASRPGDGTSGADACRSVHAGDERSVVLEGGEENS